MYVARDKDGDLYLFLTRPVKWEDEESTEVELVKKEKV